ncbi:hypothetical protein [Pseudohongiella spirulinae]|uniref:hypothetical protein n=1 Tax=Pseudohongiella spirulinae TaxID=1249552 RepID=UPI0012E343C1|nr:hypothetical protein [Pseudohongiella spirulinae]
MACLFSSAIQAQSIEDILTPLRGTYTVTFTEDADAPDAVPVANGTQVNFIIGLNNRLCTSDLDLSSPTTVSSPSFAVSWNSMLSDARFDVRLTDTDPDPNVVNYAFAGIDFRSHAGVLYGAFTLDSYAAATGTCGAVDAEPGLTEFNAYFSAIQAAFSSLFPSGPFTFTQQSGGYTFRHYDSTNVTLAIRDGQVYARGDGYGAGYVPLGSFETLNANVNLIPRPATVHSSWTGTYSGAMAETEPFSPIPDGTDFYYAINSDGVLCFNDNTQFSNPLYRNNDTVRATWFDAARGRIYRLRAAQFDADEHLLEITSTGNTQYGELEGEKISLNAVCNPALPANPDADEIERLFDLSEQLYPDSTPGGPLSSTQRVDNYSFRYYPATDVFLAVRDGQVYSGSGAVNFDSAPLGTLASVIQSFTSATSAFVPAQSLVGSYNMLVSAANPLSPVRNGDRVRVILAADGSLCIDNLMLSSPLSLLSAPQDVNWTNMQAGVSASLQVPASGSDLTIDLTSNLGGNLGQLTGNRASRLGSCPGAPLDSAQAQAAEELFALAEQIYGNLLPPSSVVSSRNAAGAVTRHYAASGITLTVLGSQVFVHGGEFGDHDVALGSVSSLSQSLGAELANLRAQPPVPTNLAGTYEALVSGANPFAPFPTGSLVRLVLQPDGGLCLNNLSLTPTSSYPLSPSMATWQAGSSDLSASLPLDDLTQLSLTLSNTRGEALGQLAVERISNATVCSTTTPSAEQISTANELFELAERRYDEYFPATDSAVTRTAGSVIFRHYESTGVSLSVLNGEVLVRGGEFGSSEFFVGTIEQLIPALIEDIETAPITSNTFSVTVTGTSTVNLSGLYNVNRTLNIVRQADFEPEELTDTRLADIARSFLLDEIENPDSVQINDVNRTETQLSFRAVLQRVTRVGSSTTSRNVVAIFSLSRL